MSNKATDKPSSDVVRLQESDCCRSLSDFVLNVCRLILKRPDLVKPLLRLNKLCNPKDLESSNWIYNSYFFSWKNPLFSNEHRSDFSKCSDVWMFSTPKFIMALVDRWVNFDADDAARESIHELISRLTLSIETDTESSNNIELALKLTKEQKKKLIIISNHISHLDAPIIDYVLKQEDILNWKAPRFVTWAYMFYNKWVRPFIRCFNTSFVFWPKDMDDVMSRFKSKNRQFFYLFRILKNISRTQIFESKTDEASVLFPYAWRSKPWVDDNFALGCKDMIPARMQDSLNCERCVYLPFAIKWPGDIFPWNMCWWWNALENFSNAQAVDVKYIVWKPFVGWDRSISEIHDDMISVSKKAFSYL